MSGIAIFSSRHVYATENFRATRPATINTNKNHQGQIMIISVLANMVANVVANILGQEFVTAPTRWKAV